MGSYKFSNTGTNQPHNVSYVTSVSIIPTYYLSLSQAFGAYIGTVVDHRDCVENVYIYALDDTLVAAVSGPSANTPTALN